MQIAIARELTKLHEEVFRGTIRAARSHYENREILGEITLVVSGYHPEPARWEESQLRLEIAAKLAQGGTPTKIAAQLAGPSGWTRRQIYRLLTNNSNDKG